MAFARVGTGSGKVYGDGSSTIAITYSPAGTGRLLTCCGSVIETGGGASDVVSVVDNNATSWTIKKTADSSGHIRAWCAYLENNGSGITSVTVTVSSGNCYSVASVDEWTGAATSSSFDQISPVTGGRPLGTGSITNTNNDELVIAVGGSDDSSNSSWAANTGYTTLHEEADTTAHHASKAVYQIASGSTGPFSTTFDYAAENTVGAALILSFKTPAVGGGSVFNPYFYQQVGGR